MSIHFDARQQTFHLSTERTSYVLQIVKDGYLSHRYWGKRIHRFSDTKPIVSIDRPLSPNPYPHRKDSEFSLDTLMLEYPGFGTSDFRTPAYRIQQENGSTTTDLRFDSYEIIPGKPGLPGLPATYVECEEEADTLRITLTDSVLDLRVILDYSVYDSLHAITRSVRFVNAGQQTLKLLHASSVSVDFDDADFDMLHLSGGWSNERNVLRRPLERGIHSIDSKRGASSPQHNPFVALMRKETGERFGEVYGFSLVYSGNFLASVEVDQYDTTRVSLGLNPFDFMWTLEPGESFHTPEAVLVYSDQGLGGMSRTYHRLYRTRLCRGTYRDKERPILVNNWEATYFDFNEEKLERIAVQARQHGIELFVLDDGWFGKRDDDTSSLGDWDVNRKKLPGGLRQLGDRIARLGMQFGLWFEPEMVNEDSELYRNHPDWVIHVPDRPRSTGRYQLVLDYSRTDVCDAIIEKLTEVLQSAPIRYVKWDMNRHMTEVGSAGLPPERQRETAHRYILGLYRVLETLTSRFPDILFESCSSGGGRFDPGMLYYMPQTWASDNSDAISRLRIQYGTSLVYPISSIGAHVTAVPNHQVGRVTPLEMRGHVAMSGVFGYELDLSALTVAEQRQVEEQIRLYKQIRPLVQFGDFYRLLSPFEGNEAAWMFVDEERTEAFVCCFKILAQPNSGFRYLRLQGLDPRSTYLVEGLNQAAGGDEWMNVGIRVPVDMIYGDFRSCTWRLRKLE